MKINFILNHHETHDYDKDAGMKEKIHPKLFKDAKIKCACGTEYLISSTNRKYA